MKSRQIPNPFPKDDSQSTEVMIRSKWPRCLRSEPAYCKIKRKKFASERRKHSPKFRHQIMWVNIWPWGLYYQSPRDPRLLSFMSVLFTVCLFLLETEYQNVQIHIFVHCGEQFQGNRRKCWPWLVKQLTHSLILFILRPSLWNRRELHCVVVFFTKRFLNNESEIQIAWYSYILLVKPPLDGQREVKIRGRMTSD